MGPVAVAFGILLIIILAAAYLGLVAVYFVFAAPVIAIAAALYVAGDLIAGYFHRIYAVAIRRAPEFELIPPYRPGTTENEASSYSASAWRKARARFATSSLTSGCGGLALADGPSG